MAEKATKEPQEDIDHQIYKTLAGEYEYSPTSAKQLSSFVKYLHNFAQYMGAHKYYSDVLNRRVALITLDSDMLALRVEAAKMESEDIYSQMEIAVFGKKKPDVGKRVEGLKQLLSDIHKDAMALHASETKLMQDIKKEYSQQTQPTPFQ